MKSLLLADSDGTSVWSIVLIVVVVVLLFAMPFVMNMKNKKESQKVQEQTNSLKVGDKILTTSGVYGTITELIFDEAKKTVVIETGGKEKSYLTIDAYAIYTVFKSEKELAQEAEAKIAAENAKKEKKKSKKKQQSVEVQVAEVSSDSEEKKD